MKASVQYNDYQGTTAADRSDFLFDNQEKSVRYIADKFNIEIMPDEYEYRGISVYGTKVNEMGAYFIFRRRSDGKFIRYCRDVKLQEILDMFKRFEFQIGVHLEDIDELTIENID